MKPVEWDGRWNRLYVWNGTDDGTEDLCGMGQVTCVEWDGSLWNGTDDGNLWNGTDHGTGDLCGMGRTMERVTCVEWEGRWNG